MEEQLKELRDVLRNEVAAYIDETVAHCMETHRRDRFNDNHIFGFHLWKNGTNRLRNASLEERISLKYFSDSLDRKFRWGRFEMRFHRVDPRTLIPDNADAAKSAARVVGAQPEDLFGTLPLGASLIVGIVASPDTGLQKIVVGEIVRVAGTENYRYAHGPFEVWNAADELVPVETVPPEEVTEPIVGMKNAPEEKHSAPEVHFISESKTEKDKHERA